MKNMMRRTVAFMLMACLLLSVMAPMGLLKAEAITVEGNVSTYTIDGTAAVTGSSKGWVHCDTAHDPYGDLAYAGKGSGNGNTIIYAEYLRVNQFCDPDLTDGISTQWLALKFTANNDGEHLVTTTLTGKNAANAPDVCIVTGDAWDASAKDDAYVTGLTTLGTTSEAVRYAFDAGKDYVVIFRGRTTTMNNTYFYGITLTRPSVVGANGSYFTIAEAVAAEETSITLTGDITEDIAVGNGATLDLNGKKVTGNVVVTDGKLIDSVGTAEITGTVNVPAANEQVVVNANGVNKLVSYTAKQNGYKLVDDTIQFWFDADFAASAYALLAADEGVTINAVLKANDVEVTVDMSEKVALWLAQDGSADNALGISVTGFKAGDVITVTPVFTTAAGNSGVFGNAITYTVPQN